MTEPLDLDAIRARCDAATPGPWRREHCGPLGEDTLMGRNGAIIGTLVFGDGDEADADLDFVLHSHHDVGSLLTRVRDLEAERDRYRTAWHSAKARASTTRERLNIVEYSHDCANEAAELIRAEHPAVYDDAGQKTADGLLHAADLLTSATTGSETTEDPIVTSWDRIVIHPDDPAEPTIVCCRTDTGRPVALVLDPEERAALGLVLVDPEGC
jgi:hypothetical protein